MSGRNWYWKIGEKIGDMSETSSPCEPAIDGKSPDAYKAVSYMEAMKVVDTLGYDLPGAQLSRRPSGRGGT